ncbi:zinc-binding dehydrogenase [Ignavibacteria bacterium 4148-Me]|uniref:zinc-dependent alcohol dehydrogenase n=1 Tax=Rosettibacter primus TaxID=3111523 RepID=UPI00336BF177
MKAAILYDAHDFRIENLPDPVIEKDECLIKIKACGVCHSEIHQWDKKIFELNYPRHIGHEISGEIIDVGQNVSNFKIGDKVAAWVDGKGYADKISIKQDRLYLMNEELSFEEAALLEPVSCSINAILKTNIQLGDTVAIIGTGFMGLILLQLIRLTGASKIIAIDIRDEILRLSKDMGADIIINPQNDNVKQIINDITNGKGVDISFESGGIQNTIDLAASICRMEGKLVIFGYHPGQRIIQDLGYWNWMAFEIINAHFRNINTILRGSRIGIQLLNERRINVKQLITHKYNLSEIEQAFTVAKNKPAGFVKSVIIMD